MAISLTIADNEAIRLQAGGDSSALTLDAGSTTVISANNYEDLTNKPSINGVELNGNKTTEDLGIEAGVSSFNGQTGDVAYTAPVTSVNGQTGAVTVTEGLAPLIGTTSTVTPQQVMTALGEGRDVCIKAMATLLGIPVELKFTSFNRTTDTTYGGQAIDVVISQTIAVNNTNWYVFELVGGVQNGSTMPWAIINTQLALHDELPTRMSELINDVNFVSSDETFAVRAESYGASNVRIENCLPETHAVFLMGNVRYGNAGRYYRLTKRVSATHHEFACVYFDTTDNKYYIERAACINDTWTRAANAVALSVQVPSKTSDLTNDSGYITLADLPIYNGGVS